MVLVDGHVHIHDCFSVPRVFDAAAANFATAARALRSRGGYDAVLCLAESDKEHFLDGLRSRRLGRVWRGRHGYWELEPSSESETFVVRCGSARLRVIAGRQLVTRERLEVLALGTAAPLRDGEPMEATLSAVRDAGGAAVLPWGVGKWLGARGAVVARVLADPGWRDVFLGDNGNRLDVGPEPAHFRVARRAGRCVLPGSDPLPLPGEEARVGGYGFAVDVALDPLRPTAALLAVLRSGAPFAAFGRRERLVRFVGNQLALRRRPSGRRG
ncbi:MAG: hypothetical protein EHM50_00610 [Lysobacterales bacterium]|nr:MAG: hypothetical protein EHM50_00610 [Xanthomonadales bacterium]